jgi:hypothetical protein
MGSPVAGRKLIDLILNRALKYEPAIPEPQLVIRESSAQPALSLSRKCGICLG